MDPSDTNLDVMQAAGLLNSRAEEGLVIRMNNGHSCLTRGQVSVEGSAEAAGISSMWPGATLPHLRLDGTEEAFRSAGIVLDRCILDARKIILHLSTVVLEVRN